MGLSLVIGPSGGGKEQFIRDLVEKSGGAVFVSLESAAALIEEERRRDESDFIEGGVDIGRTVRCYLAEVRGGPEVGEYIAQWKLECLLDRGLKYLSTGELRRVLLCRALISQKKMLVLIDPFAGLDTASRAILQNNLESITVPVVLCMERYADVSVSVGRIIEIANFTTTFDGNKSDYERRLSERNSKDKDEIEVFREIFRRGVSEIARDTLVWTDGVIAKQKTPLVEFKDVCVGWDGKKVLDHITWTLTAGEHWLIRGPNGAGKTTLLELITGDNMQVFSNEIYLFGKRRGTGETLWDLRKKLGIVSHRLHLEYRMVGGTPLEAVIISGFHDSIGLYEAENDAKKIAAKKWLRLAGFEGREKEPFSALSYGEQRAAIILRAAVKCPPILILDEPCHGLDEASRRMILDLLETIAEQQTSTLLHVTHDPTEALPCEKHIFEFHPGETPMYSLS